MILVSEWGPCVVEVVEFYAAISYCEAQVNTRSMSKSSPDWYQPKIILRILRATAVMALAPTIFSTSRLWW